MRDTYIGIDIGLLGAIVVHDDCNEIRTISSHKMPVKGDKKPSIDIQGVVNILKPYQGKDCLIIFERISQIFKTSKATAFSMGYQRGLIEAVCVAMGFSYLDIPPKDWQAEMFTGVPTMLTKDGKKDTKGMSAVAARRLNPTLSLIFPGMKKEYHDGLCDALNLGSYAIRKNL